MRKSEADQTVEKKNTIIKLLLLLDKIIIIIITHIYSLHCLIRLAFPHLHLKNLLLIGSFTRIRSFFFVTFDPSLNICIQP